jgi:hypothetical protein
MEVGLKAPDFGFDAHEINPILEDYEIIKIVSEVTMTKDKHKLLWKCIQKMADVRKNVNLILRAKFYRLAKNVRKMPEIVHLFETYQTNSEEFKTDFTKDIDDEEINFNITTALRARVFS